MLLEQVQIIKDNEQARFAVIPFEEYTLLRELLSDETKLADYLDYLHIQNVKRQAQQRFSLTEVKNELAID